MHLQQTKSESRATGGPQYYFHDVPATIKAFLRSRGACPVILETPYGIANSSFMAVGKDHKLTPNGQVVPGKVGHDRIQQGIGEAIRSWYALRPNEDFERIDVEVRIHSEGHFILAPTAVTLRGRNRTIPLRRPERPLSFHRDMQSRLWRDQLDEVRQENLERWSWVTKQVQGVIRDHVDKPVANVGEADLLRASGALSVLGLRLGPYLLGGYDCQGSVFQFQRFPQYVCSVEVKKRSKGFAYQIENYRKLPRAVVLCVTHDLTNPPDDIDVIELSTLGRYLATAAS